MKIKYTCKPAKYSDLVVGKRIHLISGCNKKENNGKTGIITRVDREHFNFESGLIAITMDDGKDCHAYHFPREGRPLEYKILD